MLFSEFVEGTGCKDNEHNHKVYKDLEVMYMNSDMSKQEIYEYGKKLVDNSKSEEQIELEKKIKEEIEQNKQAVKDYKHQIEFEKELGNDKKYISYCNEMIRWHRGQIRALKWVVG